jgi:predicted secreted protein
MTQATLGYGSKLAADTVPSTGVYTDIAEVVSIDGPSDDSALVDVTNMDSPARSREYISGLIDRGEVSFEANFLPQAPTQKLLRTDQTAGQVRNYRLTFSDAAGSNVKFDAIVRQLRRSSHVDAPMRLNVTLKVTGAPVWAP